MCYQFPPITTHHLLAPPWWPTASHVLQWQWMATVHQRPCLIGLSAIALVVSFHPARMNFTSCALVVPCSSPLFVGKQSWWKVWCKYKTVQVQIYGKGALMNFCLSFSLYLGGVKHRSDCWTVDAPPAQAKNAALGNNNFLLWSTTHAHSGIYGI